MLLVFDKSSCAAALLDPRRLPYIGFSDLSHFIYYLNQLPVAFYNLNQNKSFTGETCMILRRISKSPADTGNFFVFSS